MTVLFPLRLWCQVIPQVEHQLVLFSHYNVNTHISSYAHVYGQHDYSAEPFVSSGMKLLNHNKPQHSCLWQLCCKVKNKGIKFKLNLYATAYLFQLVTENIHTEHRPPKHHTIHSDIILTL